MTGPSTGPFRTAASSPASTNGIAIRREVQDEVVLQVLQAQEVARIRYPSGFTTTSRVTVDDAEPRLGVDDLSCDCPRMVGLDWIDPPKVPTQHGGSPVPLLIYAW